MKNAKKSNNSGITLIALVVTIIVLMILAGIVVAALMGDNGIIKRAGEAKESQRGATVQDEVTLALSENKMTDEINKTKGATGGLKTKEALVNELVDKGYLTEDDRTTLATTDEITIGSVTIDFSGLSGISKVKAVTLFEDKAGDEVDATEEKIHIGDFVNYNPIASADSGTESKYQYQSSNDYTGVTEAILANKISGFTYESQNFTTKANLRWQVIGVEENNILITTENPIIPDNPISANSGTGQQPGYCLYGAKAYVNISPNSGERNEINNIAQIYKYGKGSDESKARGMTIEDVNRVTGVIADGTTLSPSGIYNAQAGYEYGTTLTDFQKGNYQGWTPESMLDPNIDKTNNANAPGYSGKITYYTYQGTNSNLKTSNSVIRYNLVFGQSSNYINYHLASRGVGRYSYQPMPNCCGFGPGLIYNGNAYESGSALFSNKTENMVSYGVRPVIYLASNVSLTSAGTTNNVTTWNIN